MENDRITQRPPRRPRSHWLPRVVSAFVSTSLTTVLAAAPAAAQQFIDVSTAADSTPANGNSTNGMISADSIWVAFASQATNLVTGDANGKWDVFLKNLQTNAIIRVSVTKFGDEALDDSGIGGLDVNENGRVVVFESSARLVPEDNNTCTLADGSTGPCPDIYVLDRTNNITTRISVATGGQEVNGRSRRPRISEDGRYVTFSSLATNLVAADVNNVEDVFVHDRQTGTTTRVSVTSAGTEVGSDSFNPEINGDGSIVTFLSAATGYSSDPDPLPCSAGAVNCFRAFVHDRAAGTTTPLRIGIPTTSVTDAWVTDLSIDREGRFVALGVGTPSVTAGRHTFYVVLYDRIRQQTLQTLGPITRLGDSISAIQGAAISGNGQVTMNTGGFYQLLLAAGVYKYSVFDRHTGLIEPPTFLSGGPTAGIFFNDVELTTDGMRALFTEPGTTTPATPSRIRLFTRDVDNDGMADAWETSFGLNPGAAGDGALDSDGDGKTNLQEYLAGSHPTATMTRYFAEGASNDFFRTRIALLNTALNEAHVVLRFLSNDGTTTAVQQGVAGHQRVTFDLGPGSNVPANDFSTVVESDQPIAADRTMTWDATGYGAHAETAVETPALRWFLAEGATHGRFDLFYLLQNPNESATTATITYLRPAGAAPITRVYNLDPHSRRTIWVDAEDAALADTDVSAEIVGTQPIIVERAMYSTLPGQPAFAAGHDGAGVTAASTTWFLAEGATGDFFDLFVLIANPGTADATATVTYMLPDGTNFTKPYNVAHQSRLTIPVDGEDPRLAGTAVAVKVDATQPVVVERSMWWPSPNWYEGHLTRGTTTTGTMWALAEGEIGLNPNSGADTETFILIANTSDTAGSATVTLYHEAATVATSTLTVSLAANSRLTIPVSSSFPAGDFSPTRRFGAIIQSTGAPIVVERAMYTSANGLFWTAGTSSLATKLQ